MSWNRSFFIFFLQYPYQLNIIRLFFFLLFFLFRCVRRVTALSFCSFCCCCSFQYCVHVSRSVLSIVYSTCRRDTGKFVRPFKLCHVFNVRALYCCFLIYEEVDGQLQQYLRNIYKLPKICIKSHYEWHKNVDIEIARKEK